VIELDYADLVANKDLSSEVLEAYGQHGLGILTVSGVPGTAFVVFISVEINANRLLGETGKVITISPTCSKSPSGRVS
jgi:hypothetical protein